MVVSWVRVGSVPPAGLVVSEGADAGSPGVAVNLARHLAAEHGLVVDPLEMRVLATDAAPLGVGQGVVAWFAAGEPADLFVVRARISGVGIPVAVGAPRNVSRSVEGHELLLDADGRRVLFAVQVGERVVGVGVLDFGESGVDAGTGRVARWVAGVDAWWVFGVGVVPRRMDVVFERATGLIFGGLQGGTAVLTTDAGEVVVDLAAGLVSPAGQARVLGGVAAVGAGARVVDGLRASAVVGAGRWIAVERARAVVADWGRRQRHRVFPTAADRLAVGGGDGGGAVDGIERASWPPVAPGPVSGGLPGEGRWVAVPALVDAGEGEGVGHEVAVQTFVRVDHERPYARVHLFAFDMRRLGLHFVAGRQHPRSTTGGQGSGRVDAGRRGALVAAFNGGLVGSYGRFGVVEQGRLLVAPVRGLATVVTDGEGRVGLGLWDTAALPAPWVGLRQNLGPLIEAGVVNPRRVRHWGQGVAALDEVAVPRSAVGVTGAGVLVYGWSAAASAWVIGEAMRRAGVEFAMHLDLEPGQTGIELYRHRGGEIEAVRGAAAMDFGAGRWLGVEARDFFYLVRAERRAMADEARPGARVLATFEPESL